MARRGSNGSRKWRNGGVRRRHGRVFRAFEHLILSIGMSLIAKVIERRLLKALKTGGFKPAPRTAAEHDEYLGEPLPEVARTGELTASRHQVVDQPEG